MVSPQTCNLYFFYKENLQKVQSSVFSTCLLSQIMAIQSFYTPSALQSKIGTNNDILANNIKFFPPRQHEKLKQNETDLLVVCLPKLTQGPRQSAHN